MRKTMAALLAGLFFIQAALAAEPPLRVGTAADYRPLAYLDGDKVVGMEADFARVLEAQLGRPLRFEVMPFDQLLPALARGELDLVMSGLSITPARQQQVEFTRSYQRAGQMAIIRTADVMRFRHPSSLFQGGYRVGFERGTTGEAYVKADLGNASPVPFDNAERGLEALLAQRIDVLIHDAATSWYIATEPKYGDLMGLYRPLTEESLAWAVNKNNPHLREQLDRELERMRQSGVLEHIRNRWIPVQISVGE